MGIALILLAALVAYRSISGFFSPIPLQVDEAQYLGWSYDLAAGYFSKPPLIAWAISTSRHACDAIGVENIEGCARGAQALALGLAAFFSSLTAWVLFNDRKIALAALLLLALSPLFGFYSLFATTDAWLLMFWAIALWCFVLANKEDRGGAILAWLGCGLAVGMGLLTKYSMGIFMVSAVIWLVTHRRLMRPGPWLAAIVALLVFSPNLIWNYGHAFPTFAHHLEISQIEGVSHSGWDLGKALGSFAEFLGSQFVLLGPFVLLAVLYFLPAHFLRHNSRLAFAGLPISARINLLLAFAAPMLVIMSAQALLSRANANWASPAHLSIAILGAYLWFSGRGFGLNERFGKALFTISLAIGLITSVFFVHGLKALYWGSDLPKIRVLEKLRGWKETALWADDYARNHGLTVVMNDRRLLAAMKGYRGASNVLVVAIDASGRRNHHYTWFFNIEDQKLSAEQKLLVIRLGESDLRQALADEGFADIEPVVDPALQALRVEGSGAKIAAYVATWRPKSK